VFTTRPCCLNLKGFFLFETIIGKRGEGEGDVYFVFVYYLRGVALYGKGVC